VGMQKKIANLSLSSTGLNESRYSDVANSPQKGIGNLSRSAGTKHRDDLKYFASVSRRAHESLAQRETPQEKLSCPLRRGILLVETRTVQ